MPKPKPSLECPGWTDAAKHLAKSDPVLKKIIAHIGDCMLAPRDDHFAALCQSIINQQISTAAGRTINARFRANFRGERPTPTALLKLDDATLRAAGLSRQKVVYMRSLAEHFADRKLPARKLAGMTDEEIIAALIPIKGIGRWTVEMFLIFLMNRPDVLPVDDLGVRKAVQLAYGLKEMPTPKVLREMAEPWRPYRSIATWYLWRSIAKPKPA